MKVAPPALVLGVLLLGCSKGDPHFPGYRRASGDAARFVLEAAISYGGRATTTNDLHRLEAEWRYKADKDGIQIYLLGDHFADVQALLFRAFGPPAILPKTNDHGQIVSGVYAASTSGVAIQYGHEDVRDGRTYTQVLIVKAAAFK